MTEAERWKIERSPEYQDYLDALCELSAQYVFYIRKQFAEQAFEKYLDETTRKLVLGYGVEIKKLKEKRRGGFANAARENGTDYWLKDDILNNANAYGKAIYFLFDIKHEKE